MSRSLTLKLLAIAAITGVILIALMLVSSTIDERQHYRDDALKSIEASYAGPQTLIGPVLIRPYTQTTTVIEDGPHGQKSTEQTEQLFASSFPQTLDVRGTLEPNERRHGLYRVTVYELSAHLRGSLQVPPVAPATAGKVVWGEPYLALSVADVRGIIGTPTVKVNGIPRRMLQGAEAGMGWKPNLRIPLEGQRALDGKVDFDLDLDLGGTEQLSVAPLAGSNHVELSSTWHSPLFAGQFLPRTRTVGPQGFSAAWDVSSLATGTQAQMSSAGERPMDVMNVSLLTPIDPYKLSDRATKYGILFVVLTFGGFFLFEMLKHLQIHPVQYLLVGFGLAIFFLLLISFSEHMAFGLAYLLASAACIGLLTFYLFYVLHSLVFGLGFGAMLTALYGAVYGLLLSEDNALLLGSLLLFVVLAGVMGVTRRIDWYRGGAAAPPQTQLP